MDYTTMSRSELSATYAEASDELAKRKTTDVFFDELADIQGKYVDAFGTIHEDGEDWVACDYPLPAYRRGDVVTYGKFEYRSNIPCNTFKPSDRGWRRLGDPYPWVEPEYDHDAYMKGDVVQLGKGRWRALKDYVMDRPSASSDLWESVEYDEDDGEGEDE